MLRPLGKNWGHTRGDEKRIVVVLNYVHHSRTLLFQKVGLPPLPWNDSLRPLTLLTLVLPQAGGPSCFFSAFLLLRKPGPRMREQGQPHGNPRGEDQRPPSTQQALAGRRTEPTAK